MIAPTPIDQTGLQNPNQVQPSPINPGLFSTPSTIQGVYGTQVPNSFNSQIGMQQPQGVQNQPQQVVPTTF
jgi:hypothetical protein